MEMKTGVSVVWLWVVGLAVVNVGLVKGVFLRGRERLAASEQELEQWRDRYARHAETVEDLPVLEARFGPTAAEQGTLSAMSLDQKAAIPTISLIQLADAAPVSVGPIEILEAKEHEVVLRAQMEGTPARLVAWLAMVEAATPPFRIRELTLTRNKVVATLVTVHAMEYRPGKLDAPPVGLPFR